MNKKIDAMCLDTQSIYLILRYVCAQGSAAVDLFNDSNNESIKKVALEAANENKESMDGLLELLYTGKDKILANSVNTVINQTGKLTRDENDTFCQHMFLLGELCGDFLEKLNLAGISSWGESLFSHGKQKNKKSTTSQKNS